MFWIYFIVDWRSNQSLEQCRLISLNSMFICLINIDLKYILEQGKIPKSSCFLDECVSKVHCLLPGWLSQVVNWKKTFTSFFKIYLHRKSLLFFGEEYISTFWCSVSFDLSSDPIFWSVLLVQYIYDATFGSSLKNLSTTNACQGPHDLHWMRILTPVRLQLSTSLETGKTSKDSPTF